MAEREQPTALTFSTAPVTVGIVGPVAKRSRLLEKSGTLGKVNGHSHSALTADDNVR